MALNIQTLMFCVATIPALAVGERSFSIDYGGDTFLKDGAPFRYISGSIHYHRVPQLYWRDRLEKMYSAGLNAIQIYIPWNYHELSPGNYSFDGNRDFVKFINVAQDVGLLVILRPGPYICGEWDFGGFPPWILKDTPNVILRSSDPDYIGPVDRWLDVLLPMVKPLLYVNGGPIISVQVENEYGSYFTCDYDYLRYLRSKFISHLGKEVVLFTTDGAGTGYLKCGTLEGLYATVDFGITLNPLDVFKKSQRVFEPRGPLVNSEFYAGWLDHWGYSYVTVNGSKFAHSLDLLLQTGANVNIYMFHGGTNFGYTNGANYKPIQSHTTSYDYDAPMSEAGDITPKYTEIRKVISKYRKLPPGPVPPSTFKAPYGKVKMEYHVGLIESISSGYLNEPIKSQYPLSMEQVGKGQSYAYIVYTTKLKSQMVNVTLEVDGIRDRGYVIIHSEFQGILTRDNGTKLLITRALPGDELNIIVENLGHINFGSALVNNSKGIISNVTLGNTVLTDWYIYPVYLEDIIHSWTPNTNLKFKPLKAHTKPDVRDVRTPPTFWRGYLPIPGSQAPEDTYLDPRPFSKGHAFVNGFNLGRYWPSLGPQVTLFVPKSVLKPYPDTNTIVLFEVEDAPCSEHSSLNTCHVTFVDQPFLNKTVGSHLKVRDISWDFDWHKEH